MPVMFEPDTAAQLIFGLLIAFTTFGALMVWKPYNEDGTNRLAQLCQLQIFFSLLSKIALSYGEDTIQNTRNMDVLLCVLALLPFGMGVLLETPLVDLVKSKEAQAALKEQANWLHGKSLRFRAKLTSGNAQAELKKLKTKLGMLMTRRRMSI